MRRWDVKQIHSPVLGWGRSTTNEASVNSIVFKRKVITWSQQAVASSETRSNLRAFRARHSSKFSHKSNSYIAFENGMENCHFTQRCSCHDFRRSHHQAFTVRMLHQQQKNPREMHVSPNKTRVSLKHAKYCGDEICPKKNDGPCTSGQSNASAGRKALAKALLSSPGPKPWRSKGSWPKKHAMRHGSMIYDCPIGLV